MGTEIYILDLLGTFTFAFYGTYVGIRRKFDIFGIFVVAFLTAVGGGTIRDVLLKQTPAYFSDMYYLLALVLGIIFSILLFPRFSKINKFALIVDAVGLVTFAFIGASSAYYAGLGAFGIIFLATISAVGGGLLRDIAIAETPQIFYKDFYASPAIFLGILYVLFQNSIGSSLVVYGIILSALILRLIAIYFKIDLWGPWRKI
ncbi:MAG: trimeric intracellular cation channel family protein [Candidatus Pacebacteria bacterium]|nr:trimeric intracellular cation channel family protein [Candidatus Paceibacterota bacterium]